MNFNKALFLFLSVWFCIAASGQENYTPVLDSFSGKFITTIRTHEKQHVWLATDKDVYAPSESIWFKAFLLNAISQRVNTKSRFLFVDLVNEKDNVISAVILDAANQQLNARIVLPDSIAGGYYWLRAYTKQVETADTNSICVKPIFIVSRTSSNDLSRSKKNSGNTDSPIATFYPEGGFIITGANSRVGLRISDKNGTPVSINGYVKDNRDSIITHFATNMNGLGSFDFEPSGFRKYNAVINWQGKDISYPLPPFNFFAGQLSLTKQTGGYKLRVLLGDSVYSNDFVTYIIAVAKDSLIFASIGKGQYETPVAEQRLPGGIVTFYLFDKGLNLLSERSVYVHENNVHISVATDKNIYAKRDKVTLHLSITDVEQHAIPSLVAISVSDSLISDPVGQCTLPAAGQSIDNLFLTRNGCFSDEDIDLMMLAKNNTYQALSKKISSSIVNDEDSVLSIRGTVLNEKSEPSADKILTLFFNAGGLMLHSDTTDYNGRFFFPLENYTDNTQFGIEVKNPDSHKQNNTIVIDSFVYPKLKTPVSLKQYLPLQAITVKKYLNTIDWDKQTLPPVTVVHQKKAVNYDESKRISSSSTILTGDDLDERYSVGLAILKVGGMHLLNGFLVINGLTQIAAPNAGSEPLLLVDGASVGLNLGGETGSPVMNFLNSLNPKDIDFIEILKGGEGANYGIRGGNGVILVNMLSARRDLKLNGDEIKFFYAKGITNPVLFPNLSYERKDIKATATADNRSTLFWNGSFLTGDAPGATITFYTNDIPSTYKITITGITIHGDIIYKTITFQNK